MVDIRERLRDRNSSVEGLQSQLKAKDDSKSGQHVELKKISIVLCYRTSAVASIYFIILDFPERLGKSEERSDRLYDCAYLQSNGHKEQMIALKNTNTGLRAEIVELTAKAEAESEALQ